MTNTPDAGPSPTHRGRPAAMPAHLRRHLDTAGTRPAAGSGAGAGSRRDVLQTGTGRPARRPSCGTDRQTAETIAGIRSIIPMVSVVFLGMLAATIVTVVLTAFGVVPWAVPLLTALIATGSAVLVGTLNRRVRALRREAAAPAADAEHRHERARGQQRPAQQQPAQQRRAEAVSAHRFPRRILDSEESAACETPTDDSAAAADDTAAPTPEPAADGAGDESRVDVPAEDRAVDAVHGDESPSADDDGSPADSGAPDTVSSAAGASLSLSFGPKPAEDTTASAAAAAEAEVKGEAAETGGADPFTRRLQATGWKPSPLPKPTYLDAPVAEREQPEPIIADATSFTLEPQSKESLAEMFAAELGYRPELEDAAGDADTRSGPLSHGRTAIRFKATGTDSGAGVVSINDVLARRRA